MAIKFSSTEKSPLPTHRSDESSVICSFNFSPISILFYLTTAALIFYYIYGPNVFGCLIPTVVPYIYSTALFLSAVTKDIMLMYTIQVFAWIQIVLGIVGFAVLPLAASAKTAVNYMKALAANSSANCTSDIMVNKSELISDLFYSGFAVETSIILFLLYVGLHLFFLRKTIAAEEAKINV